MKKEFAFRFVLALGIFFLVYQFGIKPVFGNFSHKSTATAGNWTKDISSSGQDDYDVIILGGEPDGIAAAVSAARLGARTLLLSEGKDLGGVISHCLLYDLEIPYGLNNEMLDRGILYELSRKLGSKFSVQKYISEVNSMVGSEKNIEVKYETVLDSPIITTHRLKGLNVDIGGEKKAYTGKIFIDSTRDGKLLAACKVPFVTGSEDLNLVGSFMPVKLYFEMQGKNAAGIEELIKSGKDGFIKKLKEYRPLYINSRINGLSIYNAGNGKIVVQGLETVGLNVVDKQKLAGSYKDAVKEAENLSVFLSGEFKQFKGWKFLKAADEFYIRESKHFSGEYVLTVNNILDNTYFGSTIAMGSYPVQFGKLTDAGSYTAGKPIQYGIPLGCIIPLNIDNILMTGAKISYSSLAASSAGTIGTGIATGEAAGVTAVYCILGKAYPAEIESEKSQQMLDELRRLLMKQKFYLPKIKTENRNAADWSFPAVRQLLSLGLVAGGADNNYNFDRKAKQQDLAILLLNGIYRLNPDSYSLDLDARIRPYFKDDTLTREKAAEILVTLYNMTDSTKTAYEQACEQGFVNDVMQLRFKNKSILTMDDVYYLSVYNIKLFTKKDIMD